MPVGGSRHYQGAGLGQIGIWGCPSCGADNAGPLEQGCPTCGAGVPRAPLPSPPTPPTPSVPEATTNNAEFNGWRARHPEGTLEQAYTAGYIEGYRNARRQQLAEQGAVATQQQGVPMIGDKTYRTLIVALSHFRDHVLLGRPEEVESGEWLSAEEANGVIAQLQEALGQQEVAHAI